MSLKNPPSLGSVSIEKKWFDQVTRLLNLLYRPAPRRVTASYTAKADDRFILADATGGAVTITLPTAVGVAGCEIAAKRLNSGANSVTLDGAGAETIDGAATKVLTTQYETARLVSDGANWHLV